MVLYYVSVVSKESGFLGACVVNAETVGAAGDAAAKLVYDLGHTCDLEMMAHPVPAEPDKPIPVPIGKLLTFQELQAAFGELVRFGDLASAREDSSPPAE